MLVSMRLGVIHLMLALRQHYTCHYVRLSGNTVQLLFIRTHERLLQKLTHTHTFAYIYSSDNMNIGALRSVSLVPTKHEESPFHLTKSLRVPLPDLHNVYRTVDTGHPLPHLIPRQGVIAYT